MTKLPTALATAAIAAGILIGAATAANAFAQGEVVPGSSYAGLAGNGNTGADAFGNTWTWSKTLGGYDVPAGLAVWGTPGLGDGSAVYEGSVAATSFEISFVNPIVLINQTASPGAGGYNETTRFDVCNPACVEWTPQFVSTDEVDFYAPDGSSLADGDNYFVNVTFDEKASLVSGKNTGFSAFFTAIPEPTAWALMLVGFGSIGGAIRVARHKQAPAPLDLSETSPSDG